MLKVLSTITMCSLLMFSTSCSSTKKTTTPGEALTDGQVQPINQPMNNNNNNR